MENNNRQGCRWDWEEVFDNAQTMHLQEFKTHYESPIEPCAASSENYWKQRCEAAEALNQHMAYDSVNPCNDYNEFDKAYENWEKIKSQTPSPTGDREPKCPDEWYTKETLHTHLTQNNYSADIADELCELFATSLQGAFKKGWEKGYNDFNPEKSTTNYKYYSESGDRDCEELKKEVELRKKESEFLNQRVNEKDRRISELEKGLEWLVRLKILKDKFGKSEEYEKNQPKAWDKAKQLLNL